MGRNDFYRLGQLRGTADGDRKKVIVNRKHERDQFKLSLLTAGTGNVADNKYSSIETNGDKNGLQPQQVGPFPLRYGRSYSTAEEMTTNSRSRIDEYTSNWKCVDQHNKILTSGIGNSGRVFVTETANYGDPQQITCTFTNTPVKDLGQVILTKRDATLHTALVGARFSLFRDMNGNNTIDEDADQLTVNEFIRFVRTGAVTDTSPLGAWYAVAAGIAATDSLREGSTPRQIDPPNQTLQDYFLNNQQR